MICWNNVFVYIICINMFFDALATYGMYMYYNSNLWETIFPETENENV